MKNHKYIYPTLAWGAADGWVRGASGWGWGAESGRRAWGLKERTERKKIRKGTDKDGMEPA